MTEEIKEIFYKLRSDDYYEKHYQQSVYYEKDLNKLENHITNLQKENEDLEEVINIKEHQLATMIEKKTDYTMTNILELKIMKLQNENEELLKKLEDISLDEANIRADILLEQQDYKLRNEKAVEYIEKCRNYHRDIHNEEKIFPDEIVSLLMILKVVMNK